MDEGHESLSASEKVNCDHPIEHVQYESGLDEDGREWEQYWCDLCNLYLTPAEEADYREKL